VFAGPNKSISIVRSTALVAALSLFIGVGSDIEGIGK